MSLKDSKDKVLKQINEFQKYNDLHKDDVEKGDGSALINELRNSVEDYFTLKIAPKKIDDLSWSMFFEYNARFKQYENDSQFDFGFDENAPNGYNDLTSLFNITNNEILKTSPKEFYDEFVFPKQPAKPKSFQRETQVTEITNSYITKWKENLKSEKDAIPQKIDSIINFCNKNSQSGGNISLWEDRGNPIKVIETSEIANIVFIQRKVKEVIELFAHGGYIPTYLK